jgi:hypothetical protein
VHKCLVLCGVGSCGSVHVDDWLKIIKKRRVGGRSPRLGVNQVYLVLLCFV